VADVSDTIKNAYAGRFDTSINSLPKFGTRPNGQPKGMGWLGMLRRPNGDYSTELSIGVEIDGKETEIPLLVPTLSPEEIAYLLDSDPDDPKYFDKLPNSILQKAYQHALGQMQSQRSPFKD
jgi:hypothetical protein